MNWYPRYTGDYMRDTGHLSLAEHGAYTVLLDHYYSTGRPLPKEYGSLYRLCSAMSNEEQDAVKLVADSFFPVDDDGLRHNERADRELVRMQEHKDRLSEAGRRGGLSSGKARSKPKVKRGFKAGLSEAASEAEANPDPDPDPHPQPNPSIASDKPPRRRDEVIDALAMLEASDLAQVTKYAWSKHGKAKQLIVEVCPSVTGAEINRRAANYATHFPDCTITSTALAAHWARCDKANTSHNAGCYRESRSTL